ncbi:MAG: molybdenum cofactor biosynthesis protein MoaE [Pseudomonadota bacterium]
MNEIIVQVDEMAPDGAALTARLTDAPDTEAGTNMGTGAVATFLGICRGEGGKLEALELQHYPGMAEAQLERIARQTLSSTGATAIAIHHRHGRVLPGEPIVAVVATSPHRKAAIEAVDTVMDYLKTDAPFWKRERWANGETSWVDAKPSDDAARAARADKH